MDPRNYTHLIQHFVLAGNALTVELHESFAADYDHLSMFALVDYVSLQGVIPDQLWLNAPALTAVHVDGMNEVTSVSRSLGSLQRLRSLSISRVVHLESLPVTIGSLSSLLDLRLSVSDISSVPSSVSSLSALQRLSINNNYDLSSVPRSIGSLESLQLLHAFNCDLMSVPRSLGSMGGALVTLWLYNTENYGSNHLVSVPRSLGSLSSLEGLNVDLNMITLLPRSVGSLVRLVFVSVQFNSLSSVPRSIASLSNLQTLWMSFNDLVSLPRSLSSAINIEQLYNPGNALTSLPMSLGSLQSLSSVWMAHNEVTLLPREWCVRVESGELVIDVDVEMSRDNSTCAVAACGHRDSNGYNCDDVLRLYSGVTCRSLDSVYDYNCFGCSCISSGF